MTAPNQEPRAGPVESELSAILEEFKRLAASLEQRLSSCGDLSRSVESLQLIQRDTLGALTALSRLHQEQILAGMRLREVLSGHWVKVLLALLVTFGAGGGGAILLQHILVVSGG